MTIIPFEEISMKAPQIPANEEQRLDQLYRYQMLDTHPEQVFDDLTKLAAQICDCKISVISLVDRHRQWFKSKYGLDAPETSREVSFCGHVILNDQLMEIPNTKEDERFHDNPLCLDAPNIQFYAGAPLINPLGYRIGTICVIDDQPKKLNDFQKKFLKTLSRQVITLFELSERERQVRLMHSQLQAINELRATYIDLSQDRKMFFDYLLKSLLQLTKSGYGFIGEIKTDELNNKFLKTYSLTDISWNEETKSFYQKYAPSGLEFKNLKTLFGHVILSEQPLITNEPQKHPSSAGIPKGHPPLNAFMGLPIYFAGKMIAMVGLANKENGYEQTDYLNIKEYLQVAGEMINAHQKQVELEQQQKISNHAAKLASIGEMAAGIVHEINNPLTNVKSNVKFIKDMLHRSGTLSLEVSEKIQKVNVATERIIEIVKGLRNFSRSDESQFLKFDFTQLIDETVGLVREIYSKDGITLTYENNLTEQVDYFGNRGRIQQVLMNLITNAKDATEGKDPRNIEVRFDQINHSYVISVKDNGSGIPEEIKSKIFEPFFTTKDANKGTGIGLAMVQSIIREHHGQIKVDSTLNQGTEFKIEFPKMIVETKAS